ncbi:MAG: hypothetical protein ABI740_09330 [Alphaproteobacteria bacterium]
MRVLGLCGILILSACASVFAPKPPTAAASVELLLTKVCLPYAVDGRSESEAVVGRGDREIGGDIIHAINPTPMPDNHVYRNRYPGIEQLYIQPPSRMCVVDLRPDVEMKVALSAVQAALKARPEVWEEAGSSDIWCKSGSDVGLKMNTGKTYGGVERIWIAVASRQCPPPILHH